MTTPATPEHPAYETLRPVTECAGVVLCDNPGEMTFEGTNTVVLRAPGSDSAVVVDPGPSDPAHARAVAEAAGVVGLILVTHRHPDHTDGIDELARLTGAPVRAQLEEHCRGGGATLGDREVVTAAGLDLVVLYTPGHTADSLSIEVHREGAVSGAGGSAAGDGAPLPESIVLGDTILGRESTVLDSTDGDLGDYLGSLELLAERGEGVIGLPGHGPDVADTAAYASYLAQHRRDRLDQIRAARAELGPDADAKALTEHIYRDVSPFLLVVAEQSTKVALRYLERLGE